MLGSNNIRLEDFDISPRTGFLPEEPPLQRLQPFYKDWEDIVCQAPALLRAEEFRTRVERLPVHPVSELQSERDWKRAYLLLSVITNAYIWGGRRPAEVLPPAVSIPFIAVSAHLELPPTATYSAMNLWNFTYLQGSDLSVVENCSILHTFTGTPDEEWFYQVSIAIEARGAIVIPVMLKALEAVREDESKTVTACLLEFANCVKESGVILERMYEKCSPEVFYHQIRPFLTGSKNMSAAGLPNGVFYAEGEGKGYWHQYNGGSNAQSSLIQFFDIILGVEHARNKNSDLISIAPGAELSFIEEMRKYMPRGHRLFLQQIASTANIHEYVRRFSINDDITMAYNLAVSKLKSLRDIHIQIVTRYIINPSQKPLRGPNDRVNIATTSSRKISKTELSGTGGTQLMLFLKQSRDETEETALRL
ncbi:hypothetical protein OIDMADRAFT_45855 [Oidiodendron maius Zn]|uniref:Indoleamine 2,3-dioxygenase n=1 Tax=Oidiodendron maius (strain Zn) TaxID=913774 RepID=A0A0C3C563_OIDMZ|nr:hypothetical protein OIDMADRAFT_45855 [Oidiodendron maius Zn]